MTNFERIKNMNKGELIEFLSMIISCPEFFDNEICNRYCPFKKSGECVLEDCAYPTSYLTAEKWLSSEV